jgi:hypothetical protein
MSSSVSSLAVGIDLEPGLSPSTYQPADARMAGGDRLKVQQ